MAAGSVDLRPRLLADFLAIAETGDLARAAGRRGRTPRALVRSVRELEQAAGAPLLAVRPGGMRLTPAGERCARSAPRVLAALGRFESVARSDRHSLRVAHVYCADTLDRLLDHAIEVRPELSFIEHTAPDEQQLDALLAHRLDVAVCSAAIPPDGRLREAVLRFDPLARVVPIDPARRDDAGSPLFAPRYGASWPRHDELLEEYERRTGTTLHRRRVPTGSGYELAALRRAARGHGLLAVRSTLGPDTANHEVAELSSGLRWSLVWRGGDDSAAVRDFVALALDAARCRGWLDPPPAPAARHGVAPAAGRMHA